MIIPFRCFLSIIICLVLLSWYRHYTEHWYPKTFWLLHFLVLLLGHVLTFFLCVQTHSSYKCPNRPSFLHCHSNLILFLSQLLTSFYKMLQTFTFFSHISCTGRAGASFYWSYQCGALHSLSYWAVPVQHITTLVPIFKSLLDNHWQILSSSTFSSISLTNCLYISFSLQFIYG